SRSAPAPRVAGRPPDYADGQRICPARIPDGARARGRLTERDHRTGLGRSFRHRYEPRRGLYQSPSTKVVRYRGTQTHSYRPWRRLLFEECVTMKERSVRWRITLLFCLAAGALLAICYGGFYLIFQRVLRDQFDQRLAEIAAPIIFDIQGDPEDKDV